MSMLLSVVAGQGGIKVPGAPGTLSLAAGSDSNTQINLSWSAPSDTGGGTISGYRIKKNGSVLVADTSSTGTTYTATGLTGGTSYNFNVAAINEKGTGADGNTPSLSTTNALLYSTTGSPTLTEYSGYKSLTFTSSGTFAITSNPASVTLDAFIVASGAAGGGSYKGGGGGGAGHAATATGISGSVATWTCTVPAGGASAGTNARGGNGSAVVFTDGSTTHTYAGGSGGGSWDQYTSNCNTSGAYGAATNSPGYGTTPAGGCAGGCAGNNYNLACGGTGAYGGGGAGDGDQGGGGGGMSEAGKSGTAWTASAGGAGISNTYLDGTTDYYGGGGGGGFHGGLGGTGGGGRGYSPLSAGTVNTGGGGGGSGGPSTYSAGAAGGSGVVIVRWAV